MKLFAHISEWSAPNGLFLAPICGNKVGHRLEGQRNVNGQAIPVYVAGINWGQKDLDGLMDIETWIKDNVDCRHCLDLALDPDREVNTDPIQEAFDFVDVRIAKGGV